MESGHRTRRPGRPSRGRTVLARLVQLVGACVAWAMMIFASGGAVAAVQKLHWTLTTPAEGSVDWAAVVGWAVLVSAALWWLLLGGFLFFGGGLRLIVHRVAGRPLVMWPSQHGELGGHRDFTRRDV